MITLIYIEYINILFSALEDTHILSENDTDVLKLQFNPQL